MCAEHTVPWRARQGPLDLHQVGPGVAYWPSLASVVVCPLLTLVASATGDFIWGKSDLFSLVWSGARALLADLSVCVSETSCQN